MSERRERESECRGDNECSKITCMKGRPTCTPAPVPTDKRLRKHERNGMRFRSASLTQQQQQQSHTLSISPPRALNYVDAAAAAATVVAAAPALAERV